MHNLPFYDSFCNYSPYRDSSVSENAYPYHHTILCQCNENLKKHLDVKADLCLVKFMSRDSYILSHASAERKFLLLVRNIILAYTQYKS